MHRPSNPVQDPSRRCGDARERRRRRNGCGVTSASHLSIATIACGQPRKAPCGISACGQRAFVEAVSRLGDSWGRGGTGFAQGPAYGLSCAQRHNHPSRCRCPRPGVSGASHSPQPSPAPKDLPWDVAPVHAQAPGLSSRVGSPCLAMTPGLTQTAGL